MLPTVTLLLAIELAGSGWFTSTLREGANELANDVIGIMEVWAEPGHDNRGHAKNNSCCAQHRLPAGSLSSADFMKTQRFDGLINLGDHFDLNIISSHNLNNLKAVENGRLMKEYECADKILTEHETLLRTNNPDARFVLLQGNHCFRATRYGEAHTAMIGMIEPDNVLRLAERNIICSASSTMMRSAPKPVTLPSIETERTQPLAVVVKSVSTLLAICALKSRRNQSLRKISRIAVGDLVGQFLSVGQDQDLGGRTVRQDPGRQANRREKSFQMTRRQRDHHPPPFAGGDGVKVAGEQFDVRMHDELLARMQLRECLDGESQKA